MPINAKAKLIEKKNLTSKILFFKFEMIDPEVINFSPGQYISIDIGTGVRREYSIASSPLDDNKTFEIVVDTSPHGVGSQFLEKLQTGSEISFLGEIGSFILPEVLAPNLFFIGTGTGITPLKSMIESIVLNVEDDNLNVYVYYGTRTQEEVIYKELFEKYLSENRIDDYKIYISRDDNPTDGKTGYVGDFIDTFDKSVFPDSQFFICGNGNMIKTVEEKLLQAQVNSSQIFYEKYY